MSMSSISMLDKLNKFAFQLQYDLEDAKDHIFCDSKKYWTFDVSKFNHFKQVNNLGSDSFTNRIAKDIQTTDELDLDLVQNDINIAKSKIMLKAKSV